MFTDMQISVVITPSKFCDVAALSISSYLLEVEEGRTENSDNGVGKLLI